MSNSEKLDKYGPKFLKQKQNKQTNKKLSKNSPKTKNPTQCFYIAANKKQTKEHERTQYKVKTCILF